MDEFLNMEAEPFDRGNSDDDNANGDDDTGVRDVPTSTRGDDVPIQNPSPKCRRTTRGELARKRKKSVEQTLPTMIILEKVAV